MRRTVVFILRLVIDEFEPDIFLGTIREVTSGWERAFSDNNGLLDLLNSQIKPTPEMPDKNEGMITRRDER